ncbi:MAG: hypothetical protein Q4D16_17200 [Eubacteriales bacterium]|nr:hypothetical protein [Eubacteriales bacterium]
MKQEFIENILKAKEYEAKAFASLLPDTIGSHMKVIQRELAAMAWECVSKEKKCPDSNGENKRKNVYKVDIQ